MLGTANGAKNVTERAGNVTEYPQTASFWNGAQSKRAHVEEPPPPGVGDGVGDGVGVGAGAGTVGGGVGPGVGGP